MKTENTTVNSTKLRLNDTDSTISDISMGDVFVESLETKPGIVTKRLISINNVNHDKYPITTRVSTETVHDNMKLEIR